MVGVPGKIVTVPVQSEFPAKIVESPAIVCCNRQSIDSPQTQCIDSLSRQSMIPSTSQFNSHGKRITRMYIVCVHRVSYVCNSVCTSRMYDRGETTFNNCSQLASYAHRRMYELYVYIQSSTVVHAALLCDLYFTFHY